jgi:very-short-patch-repair endonuclease
VTCCIQNDARTDSRGTEAGAGAEVLRQSFTNQHVVAGKYIPDFFIPEVRLGIEIDGAHYQRTSMNHN